MENKPNWITFTGVDAYTDTLRLQKISQKYGGRVEWGVLFSENQQSKGNLRYPPDILIDRLRSLAGVHLAAHLCGGYADAVNKGEELKMGLLGFNRVQVNHRGPNFGLIDDFGKEHKIKMIAQSRDEDGFPMSGGVYLLFDQSGGRGEVPNKLPKAIGVCPVGYAGGINPTNVHTVIDQIDAKSYWLDMESGVRNRFNLFDLDKVEAVLEQVYDDRFFEELEKSP